MDRRYRISKSALIILFVAAFAAMPARSQTHSRVYAEGLTHPDGMAMDRIGNLWVAQHGMGSENDECTTTAGVAVVTRSRRVAQVVDDLPSCTIEGEPMGTHDVLFDKREGLLIVQGGGFTEISASLLSFDIGEAKPDRGRGTWKNRFSPFPHPGRPNGHMMAPTVEVLANIFPFVHNELNTEESNPFRIAHGPGGDQFVVDAAANAIVRRDRRTGELSIFATFDNVPNPHTPVGPPTIHAVPTGIVFSGDRFYVGSLTGFPFPQGGASIYEVDLDGNSSVVKSGLTMVTDVVQDPRDGMLIFTRFARFSLDSFSFEPNSGGVFKLDPSNGDVVPILEDVNFPLGLTFGRPGELFVSLFVDGEVLQVHTPAHPWHDEDSDEGPRGTEAAPVFSLKQNSPNPFNPTTMIAFTLPEEQRVSLMVFDVVGREVARLVDRSFAAGEHEIRFDAVGLPSGLYLYRLDAGDFSQTRHMMLMK